VQSNFALFGATHLAILVSVPAIAWGLAWVVRGHPSRSHTVRLLLGTFLAANELVWYAYRLRTEGFRFPDALPLQLCDFTLWLTVIAALRLNQWCFEFAFFTGIGGSSQAILTPDLWEAFPSYPTVYFFVAHCTVVITVLFLAWSHILRPKPGCLWRTFLLLNGFAALAAVFNAIFGTNYMYLCRKPESASLLDYFGPWPWYIATGELFALAIFTLLWLPFRRNVHATSG
jgi:hypothetical integral membrane protein (TIGR02206 family)